MRRAVTGQHLARGTATGVVLAIDESQRLPVRVAHDETRAVSSTDQGGGKRRAAGMER